MHRHGHETHAAARSPVPTVPLPVERVRAVLRPVHSDARVGERTNQAWPDETAGFYYVVVDAMLKAGFTPEDIGKIGGGNFLRVFGQAV